MQWAEVAQAEEMEKFSPLILNQVASVAEGPELIALGTAKGPTRLGPRVRAVSAASTMTRVEAPPEPTIRPVISLETSVSSRPESAIACSMAMWPKAVPWARNRAARRSIMASQSICGGACTWQRNPRSAYSGAATTPDLASRSDANTSLVLLPMEETTPIPVTTTRRMLPSRLRGATAADEPDAEVLRGIDGVAIGFQNPVADPHDQPAVDNALHI